MYIIIPKQINYTTYRHYINKVQIKYNLRQFAARMKLNKSYKVVNTPRMLFCSLYMPLPYLISNKFKITIILKI